MQTSQTLASDSYVLLNGSEDDSYLFLIPQTLTAWNPSGALSNTYLEVTCTITNTSTSTQVYSGTAYIPFAATFEKGTKYDVKINIGKNSLYNSPNNKIIPKAMKKNTYIKPKTYTVLLRGPVVMLEGSNEVSSFKNGNDIYIGDED